MGQTQSFHTVAETSFKQMNRKKKKDIKITCQTPIFAVGSANGRL